jgi:uncharacterized protein with von Willebrand factor type A (vWA) domain
MVDEVVAVARAMRAGGARVGTGEVEAAARALGVVGASPTDSYLAMRAVMCSRREDLAVFDAAFNAVFGVQAVPMTTAPPPIPPGVELALPRTPFGEGPPAAGAAEDPEVRPAAWSDVELLLEKDFAEYTDAERALARVVVAQLARRGPTRRSRRLRAVRTRGVRPDLQRTLRASLRLGGEPLDRRWSEPSTKPRKLVLVCDVSGSMATYARVLLQYMHASVATHRRVEAFAFGTRLTRLTRELDVRDPDRALARAAEAVQDWSGGTRIGHSIAVLNREHGRRIGRGAVVVILSDGWDRGDPEQLADEMARLRRSAHRVVWLNPLKAAAGYEPLARGMAAALPHTDHFLAGNSLASLAELAMILEETR